VLSSGSPLSAELGTRFQDASGPILFNLYGSSETGFGTLATPDDWRAATGTVGRSPAGTEVRILGPDRQPVSAGTVGVVFLKMGLVVTNGPQITFNRIGQKCSPLCSLKDGTGRDDRVQDRRLFVVFSVYLGWVCTVSNSPPAYPRTRSCAS
jgi:hypothetical protein